MTTLLRAAMVTVAIGAAASAAAPLLGQGRPVNGMRPADLRAHAIVGATVVTAPGVEIAEATVVIRDGVIEAVGAEVPVPPDARVWEAAGRMIYPGLIDAAVLVDPPARDGAAAAHWNERVRPEVAMAEAPLPAGGLRKSLRELGFTAAAFYPGKGVFRGSGTVVALAEEPEHARTYRERAALAVAFEHGGSWTSPSYPGSLMGSVALIRQTLLDAGWHAACERVYAENPAGHEPPAPSEALEALRPVLERAQPVLFDVSDEHGALRAARLAREMGLDLVLLGSGMEFRRLDEVAALGVPIVVPLNYPRRPDVTSIAAAERISLRDLMTWEQAPTNARRLAAAGATIALTTHRLDQRRDFPQAVRRAIRHGLSEEAALAALTVTPARLLGLDAVMGTLEPGKVANLVIADGRLFEKKTKVLETWINGRRHEHEPKLDAEVEIAGILRTDAGLEIGLDLDTAKPSAVFRLADGKTAKAKKVEVVKDVVSIVVDGRPFETEGWVRLGGALTGGTMTGTGILPDGRRFAFTLEPDPGRAAAEDEAPAPPAGAAAADDPVSGEWTLTVTVPGMPRDLTVKLSLTLAADGSVEGTARMMGEKIELSRGAWEAAGRRLRLEFTSPAGLPTTLEATIAEGEITGTMRNERVDAELRGTRGGAEEADDERFEMPPEDLVVPLGAYGRRAMPERRNVLLTGATIWTCGPEGVLEGADLLVTGGLIRAVGRDLAGSPAARAAPGLVVIDGSGRHVTPGLIDCHSHTGIDGGVNEYAQTNSAEVRIGGVIDPDDVNWYRQLAGGLTAVNQLHGSANPIGGQNSVVKAKWGGGAGDFPIEGAAPGIKFALGENVKRSENRYPDTRMGVETFIRDAFTAALEQGAERRRSEALPEAERARAMPLRRDLELEALEEILNGERLVHCHSYRQDEILMLIRVADDFGFTIGTFQHVLEGYKVAEAIALHGAGGSSFSDWWAYKVEVMDAIPHNGALMTQVGVVTSFNSDSDELARRLNTEAAKAVRYGGLEPEAALRLVTINPALQLRIDERTGSLEPGKDGDFVVWSGSPLSTYTRCEETWIEGARWFDLESDLALREAAASERRRLVQKILAETHGAAPSAESEGPAEPPAPTGGIALDDARRRWIEEEQVRFGRDPLAHRPGVCGCEQ